MITEIENKIIERIKTSALGQYLRTVEGYQKVMEALQNSILSVPMPGIFVVYAGGGADKVSQKYKLATNWSLIVGTQNIKGQDRRTKENVGAYSIIEALLSLFTRHDMGLAITPMRPTGVESMYDSDLEKSGVALYSVNFETSFIIEPVSDEAIVNLLKVNLQYFLKPGDVAKDAEDTIVISQ